MSIALLASWSESMPLVTGSHEIKRSTSFIAARLDSGEPPSLDKAPSERSVAIGAPRSIVSMLKFWDWIAPPVE